MVEIFEYERNNDSYWDKAKLHQQMIKKTLSITKGLYSGYIFLFIFDNITSQSIYAKDVLQVKDMNKSSRAKQPISRNE